MMCPAKSPSNKHYAWWWLQTDWVFQTDPLGQTKKNNLINHLKYTLGIANTFCPAVSIAATKNNFVQSDLIIRTNHHTITMGPITNRTVLGNLGHIFLESNLMLNELRKIRKTTLIFVLFVFNEKQHQFIEYGRQFTLDLKTDSHGSHKKKHWEWFKTILRTPPKNH